MMLPGERDSTGGKAFGMDLPVGVTETTTVYTFPKGTGPVVIEKYDHCPGYSYQVTTVTISEAFGRTECSVKGWRLTKSGEISQRQSYPELVINPGLDEEFIGRHYARKGVTK